MRLPHTGQSLRSFWASCSHQLQNRRLLDRPGQLGRRGSQWQELRHHLELLARLAVQIDLARLGLDDHFAAR